VRTLEYDKTKTAALYSKHTILEIPGLFKLSFTKFIFASLQKYSLPRIKTSLGQLSFKVYWSQKLVW